jgi:hypothetical protein
LARASVSVPQKLYNKTKKLKTPAEEIEKYFPGFLAFIDCTELQIPRPEDKNNIQVRRNDVLSRVNLWLTIVIVSFIKQSIKKEKA